jgi:diketogulonate reductase-like aldo/keto reductase
VSYCQGRGIAVEAYSPLGDNTRALIHGNLTAAIGAAHKKTAVQVALRWIWQHGVALTTKSKNPEHLAQDLDIFDWELSHDEMAQLDAATHPSYHPSFMCNS